MWGAERVVFANKQKQGSKKASKAEMLAHMHALYNEPSVVKRNSNCTWAE